MKKKRGEGEDEDEEETDRGTLGSGRPMKKHVHPARKGDPPKYEPNKKGKVGQTKYSSKKERQKVKPNNKQEFNNNSDSQIVRKDDLFKKIR